MKNLSLVKVNIIYALARLYLGRGGCSTNQDCIDSELGEAGEVECISESCECSSGYTAQHIVLCVTSKWPFLDRKT